MHHYEISVSDGHTDRILKRPVLAESARHALSLATSRCRPEEEPVRAFKIPEANAPAILPPHIQKMLGIS